MNETVRGQEPARGRALFASSRLEHRTPWPLAGAREFELGLASAMLLVTFAWALLAWPLLSGASVIPWDALSQFYAYLRFLSDSWHSGQAPTWNPFQYAGMPTIADPQSLLFSPVMAAIAWIVPAPGPRFLAWGELAHLLFGGLAVLGLFAVRGWRLEGGILAALVFMFGGVAAGRLQHTGLIMTYGLLPGVHLALTMMCDRPGLRRGLVLGLAAGLLLAQRDQLAFLAGLVFIGFALARLADPELQRGRFWRGLASFALAAAIALLVAAVPILLTLELLALSNRPEVGFAKAAAGSLSPVNFYTFLMPDFFRSLEADGLAWGPGDMRWSRIDLTDRSTNYLFAGVGTVLIVLWHGLLCGRLAAREIRPFVVLLLAALVYAVGRFTPVFGLLYEHVPLIALFRRPADAAFLINWALAVLAGYLVHRWAVEGAPAAPPRRRLLVTAALSIAAAALAVALAWGQGQALHVLRCLAFAAASLALAGAVIGLGTRPELRGRAVPLLVLLIAVELWAFNSGSPLNARDSTPYAPLVAPERERLATALKRRVEAVEQAGEGPVRVEVIGLGGAWQNGPIVQGLENTLGYNPLQLGTYSAATGALQNAHVPDREFTPLLPSYSSTMARMLGIRFVATSVPIEELDPKIDPRAARLVEEVGRARIYELDPLPRAFLAYDIAVVDHERLLATGRWPQHDPVSRVVVEHEPASWSRLARRRDLSVEAPSLTITERKTDRIRIAVSTPRRAILVLADPWYPGWRVRVDGIERELVRANVTFRGVVVAPGEHEVVFSFEPLAPANLLRIAGDLLSGHERPCGALPAYRPAACSRRVSGPGRSVFVRGEEGGVAAGGGGVDRDHLLGREALEVVRAAGLGACPREAEAAERLRADHRPDHAAVDIDIPGRQALRHGGRHALDPAVDAQRQPVAAAGDRRHEPVELAGVPGDDVEDGAEDLLA